MPPTTAIAGDRADACGRVGRYEIDGAGTRVEARMRRVGVPVSRVAGTVRGTIAVPDDLRSVSVRVRVDTPGPRVRSEDVDADGRSGATFEATRMEPILESFVTFDGDRPLWALVGQLTVGATTRQVRVAVGVVKVAPGGRTIAFSGSATLRSSDFGVPRRRWLLGDTVHVRVTGVAHRMDD